ncbi:hypothetical protein Taro_056397 [Colocasia esculenta]|uniref:Uncharacterized protein n=1 Tax=Colocasia esculenta TaxID=4460 RepID=A0A843XW29_COLES|nr:hypothetical protein [Colocasia esculenta]
MSFTSMTFTLVPLVGFCTSTGRLQVFRVHECRRRVFVPPSDVTRYGEYINVRDRVFVPPSGYAACIYVHDEVFVPPSNVYKLVGSSMLEAGVFVPLSDNIASTQSFGDGGGLKYKRWESCDNLWPLPADVAQCSPNAEDGTPMGSKDFSSARASYLSSRTVTL